ncbi:MAG: hypothetical protein RH917_10890 [Lacipirellulaceae bacterium]
MFVLLFGLMGVASLFPVGSHYAAQGEQFDRSTALSDAAFDELLARGILRPQAWLYGDPDVRADTVETVYDYDLAVIQQSTINSGQFNIINPAITPGRAFIIDPIGVQSALPPQNALQEHNHFFPYLQGATQSMTMPAAWNSPPATWTLPPAAWPIQEPTWPIRRVSLPGAVPGDPMPLLVADTIFSLHDTLSVELPDEDDRPAIQRWKTADPGNTPDNPTDDVLLRREYEANYTWLASVVPVTSAGLEALQPASSQYGSKAYDVSVAVFHRREEAPSETSERLLEAEYLAGGELILFNRNNNAAGAQAVDDALEDIRPGNWIAVAGVNPTNGTFLMKWYRLLSLDNDTDQVQLTSDNAIVQGRRAMLDGPEWPENPLVPGYSPNLRAILLPGIVSVTTRSIPMQQ